VTVDDAGTYADFGIPEPAPCPPWCTLDHAAEAYRPEVGPGYAEVYHEGSAIGGAVLVRDDMARVGLKWTSRFTDGAWQPPRPADLTVFLQHGLKFIAFEATENNRDGLAAIAGLISPELEARARQLARLAEATLATRAAAAS
jgi:hypothetical protein